MQTGSGVGRRIVLLLVLAAIVTPGFSSAATASAQGNAAQAGDTTSLMEVERAIDAVEAAFDEALSKRDRAALDPLLAASFRWFGKTNVSRTAFLEEAVQGLALQRQRFPSAEFDKTLTVQGSTAIRTLLVRIRTANGTRDQWQEQSHVFVQESGAWKLAFGTGSPLYEGPIVTAAAYAPYAGTYQIDADRLLRLEWDGNLLVATYPTVHGAEWRGRAHVFLRSPTEEAAVMENAGHFRFVLDGTGRPTAVLYVLGDRQGFRATRLR